MRSQRLVLVTVRQLHRLVDRPVGNDQNRRVRFQQRQQNTPGRTAGTHQEHPLALGFDAQVVPDIPYQPDAVGVVSVNASVVKLQGICRARVPRAFRNLMRDFVGFQLEWQGYVCATTAIINNQESGELQLSIANTARVRIEADGDVGIGEKITSLVDDFDNKSAYSDDTQVVAMTSLVQTLHNSLSEVKEAEDDNDDTSVNSTSTSSTLSTTKFHIRNLYG